MPAELIPLNQNGPQLQPPTTPTKGSSGSHNTTSGHGRSAEMAAGKGDNKHTAHQEQMPFIKRYRTEVSASASSVLSTLTAFPLDSVKTRMQTYNYSGFLD